ncbi:MAG: outer membrane lipoprotein carrier protein LolA [Verrucomicrobia subdivision 3 bacterium]|nr:outer membrane lipoprotein carrier protein LolA [Limisphaerales bacterium]
MIYNLRFLILLAVLSAGSISGAIGSQSPVDSWLNAQTNMLTWSAQVVQTRHLKSLAQPLTAEGRVWFAAPDRFRWEIGTPAQTIAVRGPEEMLVIYPRLKRAERFPLAQQNAGPYKDTLALLDTGFPRSRADLDARFQIASQSLSNEVCTVVLQPKSPSARRMMPEIRVAFGTNDWTLRSTELQFADGSRMHNEFRNPKLNASVDEKLFQPVVGGDIKVVEPMKK